MTTTKTGQSNKQIAGGCMAGFFNFSHLLSGKRSYLKRLPPPLPSSVSGNSTSELVESPASPEPELRSPDPVTVEAPKSTVSTFEFKEPPVKSPWKFVRESPRLSLDSRAAVDAKGGLRINSASAGDEERENQRRSPCVIARLMGLEQPSSSSDAEKKVELRRSASESRSRDYRFLDKPSFLSPLAGKNVNEVAGERKSDQFAVNRSSNIKNNNNVVKSNPRMKNQNQNRNQINQRRVMADRKIYYNTADFFPPELPPKQQQQQQGVTIYGEIERRLRLRGIDEPSNDLETLKNILEALQLKGLLHSSSTVTPASSRRNLVSDDRESPIVVITPARAAAPPPPLASPRREKPARTTGSRSGSPPVRRKGGPLSVETQKIRSSHSPVQSPRSDRTVNRSPRGRRSTVENGRGERMRFSRRGPADDEASTISECSFNTSSHTENEKWRGEEYREGRSLLERCDKLLHSIAEMNSNSNSNSSSAELQQPSPVSVLDSSFYKEDESSPSPVKKRSIHFKDQVLPELEDELWSPSSLSSSSSRTQLTSYPDHHHGIDSSSLDDPDFIYISKVFKASNYYLPDEPDLFLLLEKQVSVKGNKEENSKVSFLHRKLIFDTITEILNRSRNFPPWKSGPGRLSLGRIWAEFQRIRELGPAQDLFEVIIGVLKKDLAQDSVTGWGDCPTEISEAVLDIERLIFKDLIGESIGNLATIAGKNMGAEKYCRKLVF